MQIIARPTLFFFFFLFSAGFIILHKPVHCLLNALINASEFVIGPILSQLMIGRRLFELSIGFGCIEFDGSLKLHCLGDTECDILDAHFLGLIDTQGNGRRIVIIAHNPHGQFSQIQTIHKLSQGCARAPDSKGSVVAFGNVAFVDQTGNDMPILNGEIVMGPVNVGRNDGRKVACVNE